MNVCLVFGVSLQGGLSAWVQGLLRPSSLGGGHQPKFVGDAAWGWAFLELRIFFGFLAVWVCVSFWAASCGAGVCRPFSVLICWHDGFLGFLLVGLFHCIVWGFWVSFREGGGVCWFHLLCWYFDFSSILFLDFFL